MALMTTQQFDEFFEPYARNVEGFYEAAYWTLADEVIRALIRRHLEVEPGDHVLDAGGGTGRWALWLAADQRVHVTVADKSEAMLAEAERNIAAVPGDPPVELVLCDLHDVPELPTAGFDGVISTYGVLSFVDDPPRVFETLYRVMKPGAVGLLMSHSLTTALATKLSRNLAGPDELAELAGTRTVRWAPDVPPLRVFTTRDLTTLATDAGFTVDGVFGVTALVQPGAEDFGYPYQEISRVSKALEDPEFFRNALEMELAAAEDPAWAERGVNLMVKVRKPGASVPYSALAAVYDRWTAGNDYGRWARFIADRLPHERSRVLDVCCGTGTLSRHLSGLGHQVTGVDRSGEMLAIARAGVPEANFVHASVPEGLSGELATSTRRSVRSTASTTSSTTARSRRRSPGWPASSGPVVCSCSTSTPDTSSPRCSGTATTATTSMTSLTYGATGPTPTGA